MEIAKKDILKVLNTVKLGLAKKDMVEQMTHFMFTGDRVLAYNTEVLASHPFKTDFQVSVKAKKLLDAITKAKTDPITITSDEVNLKVISKDQEVGINIEMYEDFRKASLDVLEKVEQSTWYKLPDTFMEGYYMCSLTTMSDDFEGRGLIGVMASEHKLYGAQLHRITTWDLSEPVIEPFLIRASWAKDLRKIPFTQYCVNPSWVGFKTDDGIVFAVLIIGGTTYPTAKMDQLIQVKGTRLRLPEVGLQEAAADCINWSEEDLDYRKTMEVKFRKDLITCKSSDEYGYIVKKVPIEYDKEPVSFLISPVFLSEILSRGVRSIIIDSDQTKAGFVMEKLSHMMILNVSSE